MKEANPLYPVPVLWHKPRVCRVDCAHSHQNGMTAARYERQVILPQVGEAGQVRLGASSALVVGCGGLGSVLLYCLSGMGVGRIGFCDGDVVAESNLNRQFLYSPSDIGKKKAHLSFDKLRNIRAGAHAGAARRFHYCEHTQPLWFLVMTLCCSRWIRSKRGSPSTMHVLPRISRSSMRGVNGFHGSVLYRPPGHNRLSCLSLRRFAGASSKLHQVSRLSFPSLRPSRRSVPRTFCWTFPIRTDGRMLVYDAASLSTEFVSIARNPHCPVCGS